MDSHGNSMSFHVATRFGGSLVQIHTEVHDYSMSFIQVLFVFHAQQNVTRIFSSLFDGVLVENETESDGNPIIFLANAVKIP